MTHIVHLRKTQKGLAPVIHPLFQAKPPEEDLMFLAQTYLKDKTKDNREKLILKCLPLLRYTIGRFLCNWPITKNLVDDMVGEGAWSLCVIVDQLEEKHLENLASHVLGRIRKSIERYINDFKSMIAPRLKKNYEERKRTGKPVYHSPITSNTANIACFNFDAELFEAFEAIEKLVLTKTELKYFDSILKGDVTTEKGKTTLQKRFELFLRSLLDD